MHGIGKEEENNEEGERERRHAEDERIA